MKTRCISHKFMIYIHIRRGKMKRKIIAGFLCLLTVSAVFLGAYAADKNRKPATADPNQSLNPFVDYSFDAALYSADMAVTVKITDTEYKEKGYDAVFVKGEIAQVLMGKPVSREILMPAYRVFEEGKEYFCFLYLLDLYAYPKNTYEPCFLDSVCEIGTLGILKTPSKLGDEIMKGMYTLGSVRRRISENPPSSPFEEKAVLPDRFVSVLDMAESSTHIAEIEVKEVIEEEGTYIAYYDITELFKGEKWGENEGNFLPKGDVKIEKGGKYLVFFTEKEDGTLWPVSRFGSVIDEKAENYREIREIL